MTIRSIAFAASLAFAPLAAQAETWTIDPAHTNIAFSVNHLGFSTVQGTFRDFAADVAFDPDDLEATKVSFTIVAESVDTLWEPRDDHLRAADFLDVAKHPEITFVSTEVVETSPSTAAVTGDLTIKGETHPVTFAATLNQIGPNPFAPDSQIAGFTLTGEIDRTVYGIDFGAPAIAAVLPVTVNVELIPGS